MNPPEDRSPWQVLGLQPGASEEQVRQAYERLSSALSPGSLALYSLVEMEEQRALQQQLRAAYLTLMRAFGWDVPVLPELESPGVATAPVVPTEPPVTATPEPGLAEHAATASGEFTGAALRRVREGLGLTVAEVSQRTRIRPQQLERIEAEAFAELPQRVFVRGFVMTYARELQLDPERVWASYGKRWDAAAAHGG